MKNSSLFSDPLFSTIITLYTLILLYFPSNFLRIFSSAVIISASLLLLSLLRLAAHQQSNQHPKLKENNRDPIAADHELVTSSSTGISKIESDSVNLYTDSFVEWDVGAPLEVIHEGHEGEGDDNEREAPVAVLERYDSLWKIYPETDSGSSSSSEDDFTGIREWELPENVWGVEEKEEMIEIEFEEEEHEDNLIEIDLNPVSSPAT